MFESIYTQTADNAISISQSLIGIGVALLLGIIIGVCYMVACRKEGYSRNFIIGLVLLPVIVSAVILLIGSNVARAFSMAGAFALVRFRSAPGNAKDISVVFFAMAAGLACGLGYVVFAAVFVVLVVVVLLLMCLSGFASGDSSVKQLKIVVPEDLNFTDAFDEVFNEFCGKWELRKTKTTNMGTMFELTYYVNLKKEMSQKTFMDEIRVRNGNLSVSLGTIESDGSFLN